MSLLADLLSKVKHPHSTREVPPNLKDIIIRHSIQKRKIILISASFVVAIIISGILAVQLISSIIEDGRKTELRVKSSEERRQKTEDRVQKIEDRQVEEKTVKSVPEKPIAQKTIAKRAPIKEKVKTKKAPLKKPEEVDKKTEPKPKELEEKTKDTALRDAHLYSARNYELKKDYSRALSEYRKVLEIDKDNFTVMSNMAYILLHLGLIDEAIKYSQMAIGAKKDYAPALVNLGVAYARLEDTTQAETYLKRAFMIEPDNKTVILNLAILYERMGDYPRASEYFMRLTGLGDVTGSLGLARVYERQGKMEEALGIYKNIYPELKDTETKKMVGQRINLITEGLKK